jgi:mycothiol synthase
MMRFMVNLRYDDQPMRLGSGPGILGYAVSDFLAPGYHIRHPEIGDAAAVHTLMVASDIEDFGESQGWDIDDTESELKQLDLERDAWVAIAPDGELAGYGYAQDRQHVRIDVEIYVHPAHLGRGIGTTLVRLTEARAREHVALAPPEARVVVNNGINALNPNARSLLEREGYVLVRYAFRMELEPADEPPAASWPAGITVRVGEGDEDLRTFYETTEEAMADHWGHVDIPFAEWRARNAGEKFDPSLWFLAMDDRVPAGTAICRISDGIGWIDKLAVRRPWRRRGLGSALLSHAFRELYGRGMRRIALGVDAENLTGATRLYERAGMRVTQQYATFAKELRAGMELADVDEAG